MQLSRSTPSSFIFCGHRLDVMIIDAGDDDGVDLDRDALLLEAAMASNCRASRIFRPLAAMVDDLAVPDPAIDLGADLRINRVDRDGDMGDIHLRQVSRISGAIFMPFEARQRMVSGNSFADQPQGLHGLLGIGKGVPGTGDAGHGDARLLGQHPHHVLARPDPGQSTVLVTPGRDSLTQSYFRLQ